MELLSGLAFRSVLDVGCGTGEMLLTLREALPDLERVMGSDFAAETLEGNRSRMPWAEFAQQDIVSEVLETRFDLVTCCEVLEHVPDRRRAFANLAAMVEPGGALLVSCPTGRVYETEKRFGHLSHPDGEELTALGREHALEIVRSVNWGWPTYRVLKWATNVNADWSMQKFGSGEYSASERWINHLLFALNYLNFDTPMGCQLFQLYRKTVR